MAKNGVSEKDVVFNNFIQGTQITGDIVTDGHIKIDGHLIGTVKAKGRVVVGKTGVVDGEIICQNAQISGKVVGKITVSELLTLHSTVSIKGDIFTKKLGIEPGALFTGTCKMGEDNLPLHDGKTTKK